MKLVPTAFAGVLALALGTGCFEGGFLNAGERDKPTGAKAAFIEQVDARCVDANQRIAGLGVPSDAQGRLAALRQSAQIRLELLSQIERLVPPRGGVDQVKYDGFVSAMRNLATALDGASVALEVGDRTGAADLAADVELARRQVAEAADNYQFVDCQEVVGTELARPA